MRLHPLYGARYVPSERARLGFPDLGRVVRVEHGVGFEAPFMPNNLRGVLEAQLRLSVRLSLLSSIPNVPIACIDSENLNGQALTTETRPFSSSDFVWRLVMASGIGAQVRESVTRAVHMEELREGFVLRHGSSCCQCKYALPYAALISTILRLVQIRATT